MIFYCIFYCVCSFNLCFTWWVSSVTDLLHPLAFSNIVQMQKIFSSLNLNILLSHFKIYDLSYIFTCNTWYIGRFILKCSDMTHRVRFFPRSSYSSMCDYRTCVVMATTINTPLCCGVPIVAVVTKIKVMVTWFGVGTKITWFGWGKDCDFD